MQKDTVYCRKCTKELPSKDFYDAVDNGLVDTNGKMSVCKKCVQNLYDIIYVEMGSMEKTIHKLCIVLNIKYSNEAVDATKKHITTLLENGKHVHAIFSIYKQKLVAINKSMDKSISEYEGYEDVGTIFMDKEIDTKELPIPQDVIEFWGPGYSKSDIEFLETQYANFKQTHSTETYAEVVLLKQVCSVMLKIEKQRIADDPDMFDSMKEVRDLMKTLAISPNAIKGNQGDAGAETFGQWIEDIEKYEPAQWLLTDPRGDMYRDVANVNDYSQKYIVRPTKNFILGSKDFNIDENQIDMEDDDIDIDKIFMTDEVEDDEEENK